MCALVGELSHEAPAGDISRMHVCSGDTIGSTIVVRGGLHISTYFNSVGIEKNPGVLAVLCTVGFRTVPVATPLNDAAAAVPCPPAGATLPHGTAGGIRVTMLAGTLDRALVDSLA